MLSGVQIPPPPLDHQRGNPGFPYSGLMQFLFWKLQHSHKFVWRICVGFYPFLQICAQIRGVGQEDSTISCGKLCGITNCASLCGLGNRNFQDLTSPQDLQDHETGDGTLPSAVLSGTFFYPRLKSVFERLRKGKKRLTAI